MNPYISNNGLSFQQVHQPLQYDTRQEELGCLLRSRNIQGLAAPPFPVNTEAETESPIASFGQGRRPIADNINQIFNVPPLQPGMTVVQPQSLPRALSQVTRPQSLAAAPTGPRFHPEIGWYYAAQCTVPPIMPPAMTDARVPRLGPRPVELPFPTMPASSSSSEVRLGHAARFSSTSNPRCGSGAELATRPKARIDRARVADEVPQPVSEHGNRATPKGTLQQGPKFVLRPRTWRGKHRPKYVKKCVCPGHDETQIKRPKNAFILFRTHYLQDFQRECGSTNNASAISKLASVAWKKTDEGTKKRFRDMAEKEKQRHAVLHPDYKFKPGHLARLRFGSESCTCGAFAANLAEMNKSRPSERRVDEGDKSDAQIDTPSSQTSPYLFGPWPQQMISNAPAGSHQDSSGFASLSDQLVNSDPDTFALNILRKRKHESPMSDDLDEDAKQMKLVAKRRSSHATQKNHHATSCTEPNKVENFPLSQGRQHLPDPNSTTSAAPYLSVQSSLSNVQGLASDLACLETTTAPLPEPDYLAFELAHQVDEQNWDWNDILYLDDHTASEEGGEYVNLEDVVTRDHVSAAHDYDSSAAP